jgi:purine-binding chemotaxis protein CheW
MDNFLFDDEDLLNPNSDQYFLFITGGEKYALNALCVVEILECTPYTKVPKCNSYIKGIVNIRGTLVGIIDLQERFGLGMTEIKHKTSIVIIKSTQNHDEHIMGVIIDEIFEVDGLDPNSFLDVPSFGTKIDKKFIKNIAKYNNEELIVLDENGICNLDEIATVRDTL